MDYRIDEKDRKILRELAKKQLELSQEECNQRRIKEWYLHNDLKGEKPMVQLEMWGFTHETILPRQKCTGEFAREIEFGLYTNFLNQELFDDDRVTPDFYGMNYEAGYVLFGLEQKKQVINADTAGNGGSQHIIPVIEDLEEDYHLFGETRMGFDLKKTEAKRATVEETIGDILPVRMKMDGLYSVPMQNMVNFMGMQNMMYALADCPDLFKRVLDRIAEDTLAYYRMLEENRLILPTISFENVAQGSMAFTHDLPGEEEWKKRPFTTKDVWGFMDAQETVSISPDMYEEIVFPCYEKVSSAFGLLSYGCCEPVSRFWDRCISRLKNLRKVSISPWCDEAFMGERLAGTNVIYYRKPSSLFLGTGTTLDEEAIRKHIRYSLECARGCKMEITQRDIYTINHDEAKARRYVEIIRDEIDRHWK